MQRTYNLPDTEPEQMKFERPSEGEHLFTVSDIKEDIETDPDVIHVKCEVTGGEEEGRTILNRLNLDENSKGFFAVRLFLKAINLPHKGKIEIDTDDFQARQFYATITHNGKFANIQSYNFDKIAEQPIGEASIPAKGEELNWEE